MGGRLDPVDAHAILAAGRAADLLELSRHPDLPPAVFGELLSAGYANTLALNSNLSHAQETTLLACGRPTSSLLARNRHLSFASQRLLLERFPDHGVMLSASGADLDPIIVADFVKALPAVCTLSVCSCAYLSLVMEDPEHRATHFDALLAHPRLRVALMADPALDPIARERLLTACEGTTFFIPMAWRTCRSGLPDPELLARFANHGDIGVRRASALAPGTREHFERLLERAEPEVLHLMASNPALPADLQARLMKHASTTPSLLEALAASPALDPLLQSHYLFPGTPGREVFAANSSADPSVLRELHDLARDEGRASTSMVLASVLTNPSLVLDPGTLLRSWVPDLLACRPLDLFAAADVRHLDPETFDTLLEGFEGSLEDLLGVVGELGTS